MTRLNGEENSDSEQDSNTYTILAHTDYAVDVGESRSRGLVRVMARKHIPVIRAGGVDVICDHVGGDTRLFSTFPIQMLLSSSTPLERALHNIECMFEEESESPEQFSIIRSFSDIRNAKEAGKLGVILSLQGGMPINHDLALLGIFHRLGVRCMHLTAALRNNISDSCMGRSNGGLTDFGIEVVKRMNDSGITIDLSQLSPRGCLDVLEVSRKPVIASNSNARSLYDHPRNLDDAVIEAMGKNGGVMCVHCLSLFITDEGTATLDDLVDIIEYMVGLAGVDHVGVGPDLLENWPSEVYEKMWGHEESLESSFTESSYVKGLESISEIPNLRAALIQRGFSEDDCHKIMGHNLLRVFRETWNA